MKLHASRNSGISVFFNTSERLLVLFSKAIEIFGSLIGKLNFVISKNKQIFGKFERKHNTLEVISIFCILHCVKSVLIRNFYGPYSVRMQENTDQKNSKHGHSLRNAKQKNFI